MGALSGNLAVNQSAISDISDEKNRTKNFGLVGAAFGASFFIGPALGGFLSDPKIVSWFYYDLPFWLAAILTLVNFIQVLYFFPETLSLEHRRQVRLHPLIGLENIIKAWQNPARRSVFLVVFFVGFGFNFFTQFNQVFLIDKFAATTSQIGWLFSYIGLVSILVQLVLVRHISKRFRPAQVLIFTLFFLAGVLPVFLIMPSYGWIFLAFTFVPIFNGLSFPNLISVISSLGDARNQGELLGMNQSIQALAQFLPPLLGGFVAGFHVSLSIWISSACIFIGWLLFIRCRKHSCIV